MTAESSYYGGTGILANITSGTPTAVQFAQLVSSLQTLQTQVQALRTTVGSSSSGLVKDVNNLKTRVTALEN